MGKKLLKSLTKIFDLKFKSKENIADQLGIGEPTKVNHAASFANAAASFQQPRTRLIAVLVTVLIIATVVVIPVAVILSRSKSV